MITRSALIATMVLVGGTGQSLSAQGPTSQDRPFVAKVSHWGRWATLAGAAGLITVAAVRHHDAQNALGELEDFCRSDGISCIIVSSPDGGEEYMPPDAEDLFQEYAALDKSARSFLLGGQLSLLTSGAMFLIDIIHRTEDLDNIPYTPLELYTAPDRLGLALRF